MPSSTHNRSASASLSGRRIVVTRAAAQARALIVEIEAAGATAIALPTIRIEPPRNPEPLLHAIHGLGRFDGAIFTSANAVASFFRHWRDLPGSRREAGAPAMPGWVCAVGPATAAALAEQGWVASIVPSAHHSEGVVAALCGSEPQWLDRQRILFPRAEAGRDVIPLALAALGAEVCLVEAYRTTVASESRAAARELFPPGGPAGADAILFTSASTVRHLARLLGDDYRDRLLGVTLAAIGPATRRGVEELGLRAAVEAAETSNAGLRAALAEFWRND